MLRKYASKILGLKFARKNPLVYNWYNQEIKLASSRLADKFFFLIYIKSFDFSYFKTLFNLSIG